MRKKFFEGDYEALGLDLGEYDEDGEWGEEEEWNGEEEEEEEEEDEAGSGCG